MSVPFKLGLVLMVGCVSGCGFYTVSSVHPLYTDDLLTTEAALVGTWIQRDQVFGDEGDSTWTFTESAGKAYELIIQSNQERFVFSVHLVRLGEHLYMDLFPKDVAIAPRGHSFDVLFAHHFVRLNVAGDVMQMPMLDLVAFRAAVEKAKLPHTLVENQARLLLTASSKELQEFLLKRGNAVFRESRVYYRRK